MEVQQQPWELQDDDDDDELGQGLIARRRNIHQTPFYSTTINFNFNGETNTCSIDDEEPKQQGEDEDEVVKDFIPQNGIKIDEDEKQKERSEYCVYYDTDKGIWKCRICSWDCEGRTCVTDHNQDPSHMLVNVKTVGHRRPFLFRETKGTGLHHESSAIGIDSTSNAKNRVQENTNVTNHNQENGNGQNGEHQKHDDVSEISFDKSSPSYINNKTESSDLEVIKDGDNEITEFDVETVLKKQDTHDLYCPNCNSCITKRVILRKRKRRIPAPGEDAKRNKAETFIPSQVNVVSSSNQAQNGADLSLDDVQLSESNEYDHQREPDVFRCLSCFSIFMPTGTGFKLFRIFGNKSEEENNQPSQKEVAVKKHWFSSIFTSDKVEQSNNQDAVQSLDPENNVASLNVLRQETTNATMDLEDPKGHNLVKDKVEAAATSSVKGDENAASSTQESVTVEELVAKESNNTTIEKGRIADTHDRLLTSYHIESNGKSDYPGMFVVMPPANNNNHDDGDGDDDVEPIENDVSPHQHDGLRLRIPPNVGSLIIDNSQMNQELDVTVQMNTPDEKGGTNLSFSPPASMLGQSKMKDVQLPTNLTINGKELKMDKDKVAVESTYGMPEECSVQNNVEIHLQEPLKDVLTDKQMKLVEDLKNNESIQVSIGKDTIISIDNKQLNDASVHQRSPVGTPALQHVLSGSQQGGTTTPTGGRSLDIVKSIVYGGLMESIASLSVVSSAAGANAATLNVLALGLANIFGGLFVISHDLWDLKKEPTRISSEDRYQQFLGRRSDFTLHIMVCLLSYLVFGFLPPVVYGFSFRESNNRDLKLVMVATASVFCITTLAAGKAYVQKKAYFKTIAYYVAFGFMVSGTSYLFGDLIMKLLEKIDVFHSGSVVNLLRIHGMNSNPALATY